MLSAPFLFEGPAVIAVMAGGYATELIEVDPRRGTTGEPVRIEARLSPESRISGVVLNPVSGKPVPGAFVAANIGWDYTDWRQDAWEYRTSARSWPRYGLATTDKLGRFSIGNLLDGHYDVFAGKAGCPLSVTTEIVLRSGEHAKGVVVEMLGPTTLDLQFTGVKEFDPTWRVRVGRPPPEQRRGARFDREQGNAVPISADGKARILGAGPGEHELELLVAHPFRLGGLRRKLDITRIKVEKELTELEVDLSAVAPTPLRGRLNLSGSPIPVHRLLVVAEPTDLGTSPTAQTNFLSLQGARSFVEEDGSFVLACPPGTVRLLVLDAATGVIFEMSETIEHGVRDRDLHVLDVAVARLRIFLKRGATAARPGRLEVRAPELWPGGLGRMRPRPTDDDTRAGAWLTEGQNEIVVYLPDSEVELWVRTGTDTWRTSDPDKVYARVRYVPKPGGTQELEIEI